MLFNNNNNNNNSLIKALEAIDECGHMAGLKHSQLNKARTLKEVREMESQQMLKAKCNPEKRIG